MEALAIHGRKCCNVPEGPHQAALAQGHRALARRIAHARPRGLAAVLYDLQASLRSSAHDRSHVEWFPRAVDAKDRHGPIAEAVCNLAPRRVVGQRLGVDHDGDETRLDDGTHRARIGDWRHDHLPGAGEPQRADRDEASDGARGDRAGVASAHPFGEGSFELSLEVTLVRGVGARPLVVLEHPSHGGALLGPHRLAIRR